MKKSGRQMMMEARIDCHRIAEGPYTPVVFERYEWIGGERGVTMGYPSETVNGQFCICWTHSSLRNK